MISSAYGMITRLITPVRKAGTWSDVLPVVGEAYIYHLTCAMRDNQPVRARVVDRAVDQDAFGPPSNFGRNSLLLSLDVRSATVCPDKNDDPATR